MHLLGFMINSPINHTVASWADERDERLTGLGDFGYWADQATTLERGKFDGVFFADAPATYDHYQDSPATALEYGVCSPPHDPMPVVAVMAAATERLGIATTLSTAAAHPYTAVRKLSTLDSLSKGRLGWNVVTGHLRAEHRALGLDQMGHDERYDQAEEYMQVCYELWDSWQDGALLADKESGRFADPSKIKVVDHDGKYYRCHAPGPAMPSPQGRPVIFQAGSSPRGTAFAVKHAEVIFAIQPTAEQMVRYVQKVRAAESDASLGRRPASVVFGVQCIVADTSEQARAEQARLHARIPVEAGLARLSGTLGIDFSAFDLDAPLEDIETEGSRGTMTALSAMVGSSRRTIKDAALLFAQSTGMPQIVGSAEDVADQLEHLWSSSGAAGFNISPTHTPGSFETFVDEVVPRLQKKGIFRTEYTGATLRENLLGE